MGPPVKCSYITHVQPTWEGSARCSYSVVATRKNGESTSVNIRLPHELLEALRARAAEEGLPYQRFIKRVLSDVVGAPSSVATQPVGPEPAVATQLAGLPPELAPPAEPGPRSAVPAEGEPLSVPAEPSDEEPEAAHEEEGSHAPGREGVTPPPEDETPWDFLDSV